MATLTITYSKSAIGYTQRQKDTIKKLGLRRLGQQVTHEDHPAIRGMVAKVSHLVSVEEGDIVVSIKPNELRPPRGATHSKKRVGRGNGSGTGTYAGKGLKGQNSRSGGGVRLGFEGGQMPLYRRLHTLRGFNNKWRVEYQPVNLLTLERRFESGATVSPDTLQQAGIIRHQRNPVKILGSGELTKKLNVTAHKFSAAARAGIEAAGGSVTALHADDSADETTSEQEAS